MAASCVPGIAWPGLATAAGAQMLAMQWQLEQTQWWPRERVLEHQFAQIRLLAAHALANVPHYRGALEAAGLASVAELDAESFRRWPLLRKVDVRINEASLRAQRLPPEHGAVFESETTGSTGTPVRIQRTSLDNFFSGALVVREHLLHGRDFSRKLGTIRAGVTESRQPGWGVLSAAYETGPACAISLYEPLDRQLDWLLREQPAYLLSPPNNVRELVLLSRDRGRRPQGLAQVMTFAASQPADLRALVQEEWGVEVVDSYSCAEAASIAMQCPGQPHYLVHAENVYVEVLRDDGAPCEPGECGRVVVTPLHNHAMPLIRYELGDYAVAGGSCPTGRGLPTLERIAGRVRNMLRDPEGRMRSPNLPPALWLDTPVRQYRLVQHALDLIEIQYVMDRPLSDGERERLTHALAEALGYPFFFRLNRVPAIERQKGGKFEEFLSLLPEGKA